MYMGLYHVLVHCSTYFFFLRSIYTVDALQVGIQPSLLRHPIRLSTQLFDTSTNVGTNIGRCFWLRPVYIRSMGAFLPNDAVPNDQIEEHIGTVLGGTMSSAIRKMILRSNKIRTRHYAMIHGKATHLGIDLAAEAVTNSLDGSGGVSLDSIGMLAMGTTVADVKVPGFANLLHGKLNTTKSMDCLSSAGVCISSMSALKAAAHAVTLGEHDRALVVGCETASHSMCANRFEAIYEAKRQHNTESLTAVSPQAIFGAEFLRYMLSDGAGCALLDTVPHPTKLSYRIEGFFHHSFAHELPPAMVMGAPVAGVPITTGSTYNTLPDSTSRCSEMAALEAQMSQVLRQDVNLLNNEIIPRGAEAMRYAVERGFLDPVGGRVDWVFPHISSFFFHDQFADLIARDVLALPRERIWTNLASVGNVGSASALLMLWGALGDEGPGLAKGDRVLVAVPESGSFSYSCLLLTVCDSRG